MTPLYSLEDIRWPELLNRRFTASPEAWEDQVLYFVMVDRFSDGNERGYRDISGALVTHGETPPFSSFDYNSAVQTEDEAARWRAAGDTFCGGNLQGLTTKLGYLSRMGVTTIWLSPVLKQARYDQTTYHGYGTQDFLDIDPHFGTREELRLFVSRAHELGMYVVLDIIFNHAGNVFSYSAPDQSALLGPSFNQTGTYPVVGFNDAHGQPTFPFSTIDLSQHPTAWPDGAIWPRELQREDAFARRGCIDAYEEPEQFLHGDFMKLKDFALGTEREGGFRPSIALQALTQVYLYWMAYADLDGYRIDAVKHMELGAVAYFVDQMQGFAKQLGKENFYCIGEVAGGRARAAEVLSRAGLSAILAVDDVPGALEQLVKGTAEPEQYFNFFSNDEPESVATSDATKWQRHNVVTMYDDHDQIRNGYSKARFAAGEPRHTTLAFGALATLVTTMGIPCVYYGSEQAFDGEGGDDNYIRETMFGGAFGAFRSTGKHCFNESSEIYQHLARLLKVRRAEVALRRGSQALLSSPQLTGDSREGVIVWRRQYQESTIFCALNISADLAHSSMLAPEFLQESSRLQCLFSTNVSEEGKQLVGNTLTIQPAGFVVYRLTSS